LRIFETSCFAMLSKLRNCATRLDAFNCVRQIKREVIMKNALIVASTAFTVLTFVCGQAFSEQGRHMRDCREGNTCVKYQDKRLNKIADELKLDETQKQKVSEHKEKYRGQTREILKSISEKNSELRKELGNNDFDDKKVAAIKNDILALHTKRIDSMIDGIRDLKQILTPEQFTAMNEKIMRGNDKHHKDKGKDTNTQREKRKLGAR